MPEQIPTVVIQHLHELGSGHVDLEEAKARLQPFEWVNYQDWNTWDAVTAALSREQLISVAKGLVKAEPIRGWGASSVAPAIWVFRMLQRRFPMDADPLAEWMLANSGNPWVPFGSDRGSARSLAELRAYKEARTARREASDADAAARWHLRKIKEEVRHRIAGERRAVHAAMVTFRRQLLAELGGLPVCERIKHIAWDDSHSLAFYPAGLADGSIRDLCQTDSVSLNRLILKAASRRRGPWRAWLVRLRREATESGAALPASVREALGLENANAGSREPHTR
jgi:hypothetical protein